MPNSQQQLATADRVWKRFGEMYGSRFFESFGDTPTQTWIDALGELKADQIRAAISRIRNSGGPHPPSLPEFVALAKNIQVQPIHEPQKRPEIGPFQSYGNRALYSWLRAKPNGASLASIKRIVAEKNRLCSDFELICSEEPEASLDLRDKLFEAWEREYEPMPASELEIGYRNFHRLGHLGNIA